ncbi:MAG: hypothetical protein A2086_10740 [Spirochaetes bacterium GWD1_27_9]|nr:MAG: hypothetical protein A2Z98_07425 [Spirochaetes bacterium GWB1_27_13]OHD21466.1 MAG: hypothetical protein A2Y34_01275 [Spirochaetes bacterium GWC1_27_15]OHD35179.1 MAG: hypothetical protein A2086_10740 [Spirochaetes bacterium GWD1_27_9]
MNKELDSFLFFLFVSYLRKTRRYLPVFLISPQSYFYKDLNISALELRGLAFGFVCYLIDYYNGFRYNKNLNYNLEKYNIEKIEIALKEYFQLFENFYLFNDIPIKEFLDVFKKSLENCKKEEKILLMANIS